MPFTIARRTIRLQLCPLKCGKIPTSPTISNDVRSFSPVAAKNCRPQISQQTNSMTVFGSKNLCRNYLTSSNPSLPHLTSNGNAHMIKITDKAITRRSATAIGAVYFSSKIALELIRTNSNKKGDVLALSRISGIMAAKKCSDLIVLCHPITIESVTVDVNPIYPPRDGSESQDGIRDRHKWGCIQIKAQVTCEGKTGVEMEALTAVMGAALAVVDMCKAVDKGMVIDGVKVVEKRGGRSGDWVLEKEQI
jgi:molybdenum cofactor biosynthesis protein MoaC